jgi:guanylate kinase
VISVVIVSFSVAPITRRIGNILAKLARLASARGIQMRELTLSATDEQIPALVDDATWSSVSQSIRFVFLDGASGSGKSTVKNALLRDPAFRFSYARRYTTRATRPDDAQNDDYIFVSMDRFLALEAAGDLIERRHFLFGMSYGVGKSMLAAAAKASPNVLSLMNLGNVREVKSALPHAICILIDAPLEAIELRIRRRGFNSDEQIAERLESARTVKFRRHEYDFVLLNEDSQFDAAYASLKSYLRQKELGG